jgi:hypothetical protein
MPPTPELTRADVVALLAANRDRSTAELARDGELVKALTAVVNATVKFSVAAVQKDGVGASVALIEKGTAVADLTALGSPAHARTVKTATMVTSNFVETVGLAELAGASLSPARAGVVVTAVTAKKLLTVAGITDQKLLSQCQVALLSMSATALTTALLTPTGVGFALGAVALASEVVNMGMQCQAEGVF